MVTNPILLPVLWVQTAQFWQEKARSHFDAGHSLNASEGLTIVAGFPAGSIDKPSFLTDVAYLMIGPLWIVAKILRRMGVAY